jgi:hypothetical protein
LEQKKKKKREEYYEGGIPNNAEESYEFSDS